MVSRITEEERTAEYWCKKCKKLQPQRYLPSTHVYKCKVCKHRNREMMVPYSKAPAAPRWWMPRG